MKKATSLILVLILSLALAMGGISAAAAGTDTAVKTAEEPQEEEAVTAEIVLSDESGSVTITQEGVYRITGTLSDGQITVNAPDAKVTLLLDSVDITAKGTAAICVAEADKVKIELTEGSENALTSLGEFNDPSDDGIDAVIFGRDDITIKGTGTLTVTAEAGNGIVSKDDLKITGGTISVNASGKGLSGNDSVEITGGTISITAGDDAIHSKYSDDPTLGNIVIEDGTVTIQTGDDAVNASGSVTVQGGTLTIRAADDGIHGTDSAVINGGVIDIQAPEGIEATYVEINGGDISISATDDGINASQKTTGQEIAIVINGGTLNITMGAGDTDALDSNGSLTINGGTVNISAQFAFDYVTYGTLNGGTVTVNGTQVTSIPNSMMGGMGFGGGQPGGFGGGQGGFGGGQGGFGGGQGGFGGGQGGFGGRR